MDDTNADQITDDLTTQIARRDRFVRHRWRSQTWEQRMADLDRLQELTWAMLRRSPDGYARFLRRNFHARATDWTEPDVA